MTIARFAFDLLVLTKYRITSTALFTGWVALVVHGALNGGAHPWSAQWPVLLAMFGVGGAANCLNQIFERHKDARMERTRTVRPLAAGRMSVWIAWVWAALLFVGGSALFVFVCGSWLAAALGAFTVLYYSFFYTLYLKPRHHLNIVIGGVPGAMGPVLAWAAIDGGLALPPLLMAAVIVLWTPPHAWALAIHIRDDYARAGIPMLPVVKGVDETTRQIFAYTVVLVAATLALPWLSRGFGWWFLLAAVVLGAVFIAKAWALWRARPMPEPRALFRYSLIYIAGLFAGLVADAWSAP